MIRNNNILLAIFLVIDLFIVLVTFVVVVLYNFNFNWPETIMPTYYLLAQLVGILWFLSSIIFKTYKEDRGSSIMPGIWKIVFASLASIFLLITILFLIKNHSYSRIIILSNTLLTFLLLAIWHVIRHSLLTSYRRRGFNYLRVLLIGEGVTAERIYEHVKKHPENGYKIEEYVNNNYHPPLNSSNIEHALITSLSKRINIDDIICTIPLPFSMDLEKIILEADNIGARVKLVSDFLTPLQKRHKLQMLDGIPIINVRHEPLRSNLNLFIKRFFDIIISSTVLLFLFPLILPMISLIIIFDTRRNPFFIQKRVGISGKFFNCIKFRTMKNDGKYIDKSNPENDNASITESINDPRITRIGSFLRKYNLDEVPQFINVFINQMSLVGPRPHMVLEDNQITQLIKRYKVRQYVKPGITGWAAINGYRGGTTNLELMQKRIDYDIWYLENWTLWLDIKICAKTLWNLVRQKNMGH